MTSGDVLTAEQFNAGLEGLKVSFDRTATELKHEIRLNAVRIEEVKNTVNLGVTAISIVIALVGVFAPILILLLRDKKEARTEDEHIRKLIREELERIPERGNV